MIWRIRSREDFKRLAEHGTRVKGPKLWCKVLIDETATPPRVAFSISRAVGPATTRNRLRRRLRALLQQHQLPEGWWLVGVRPSAATLTFEQLSRELETLVKRVRTTMIDPR